MTWVRTACEKITIRHGNRLVAVLVLIAACEMPGTLVGRARTEDGMHTAASMLRSGQYEKLILSYGQGPPVTSLEKFILASAHAALYKRKNTYKRRRSYSRSRASRAKRSSIRKKHAMQSLSNYLAVVGISCGTYAKESILLACLRSYGKTQYRDDLMRLSLYKAAKIARELGMIRSRIAILDRADIREDDPLSKYIFSGRIAARYRLGLMQEALAMISQGSNFKGPSTQFWKARIFRKNGDVSRALALYFDAARRTRSRSLKRDILKDLRSIRPGSFQKRSLIRLHPFNRNLMPLAPAMNRRLRRYLNRGLIYSKLRDAKQAGDLKAYGILLIYEGQYRKLINLSRHRYADIVAQPEILASWMRMLHSQKRRRIMMKLMQRFDPLRRSSPFISRILALELSKRMKAKKSMQLILDHLELNPFDYKVQDLMVKQLIGKNSRRPKWAPEHLWKMAEESVPRNPARGRFVYWRLKHLRAIGRKKDATQLRNRFYGEAPGSFYIYSILHGKKNNSFRQDWNAVRDRSGYMLWLSKYSGQKSANRFLASKYLQRYMNPAGIRLADSLKSRPARIPNFILQLYRLGEYRIGNAFFRRAFQKKLPTLEMDRYRHQLGLKTGNLFLSVYYLRRVLRRMKIPEDPYSLPPSLLKKLYPRPYLSMVQRYARRGRIPPEAVYAIMRQESLFRETATSRSDARGLMQVLPSTGRWLAGKMRINKYNLYDAETSIKFGSKFFSDLMRMYKYDFRWAAIAYNGGPGNLRRWKRRYYKGDINSFLEAIPIGEPRNYARITFQNFRNYDIIYTLYR